MGLCMKERLKGMVQSMITNSKKGASCKYEFLTFPGLIHAILFLFHHMMYSFRPMLKFNNIQFILQKTEGSNQTEL